MLAEQIDLFTEAVAAKDHVVVDLTNKVDKSLSLERSVFLDAVDMSLP